MILGFVPVARDQDVLKGGMCLARVQCQKRSLLSILGQLGCRRSSDWMRSGAFAMLWGVQSC